MLYKGAKLILRMLSCMQDPGSEWRISFLPSTQLWQSLAGKRCGLWCSVCSAVFHWCSSEETGCSLLPLQSWQLSTNLALFLLCLKVICQTLCLAAGANLSSLPCHQKVHILRGFQWEESFLLWACRKVRKSRGRAGRSCSPKDSPLWRSQEKE